jgi:hypothetical protein
MYFTELRVAAGVLEFVREDLSSFIICSRLIPRVRCVSQEGSISLYIFSVLLGIASRTSLDGARARRSRRPYSKLNDDTLFRQEWAERVGLGFQLATLVHKTN